MSNPNRVSLHIEAETMKDVLAAALELGQGHPQELKARVLGISEGPRFQVNGDIVLDRSTGLEWTRENVPGGRMTYKAAGEACGKLTRAGGNFRLPTIRELLTLVDYDRYEPAIDEAFKCDSSYYWTSTPLHSSPGDCAWIVFFGGGVAYWDYQGLEFFVRAVRASQSLDLWHAK